MKADTNEFRAPTVGLEDKIFTIGTTADAAKFEVVKEELGKHFATQPWSDGADAVMAFESLTEPSYDEPEEPDFPLKMVDYIGDKKVEDHEYELKLIWNRIHAIKYARCDNEYPQNVKKLEEQPFSYVCYCPTALSTG